jgi:hypothetical protein
MEKEELEILEILDKAVSDHSVKQKIDKIVGRVEDNLNKNQSEVMAWEPIPLDLYQQKLPGEIKSSWVFILRKNTITGAERHPNSRQRMMSYRGKGDFQTKPGDAWISHFLDSSTADPLEKRWISIPHNVWHQGIVGNENWIVVSFQTTGVTELIEERSEGEDTNTFHRKKYVE